MQGYYWAKSPENALFVVLLVAGKGYVPGREDAINMDEIFVLEPVTWPDLSKAPNLNSDQPKLGPRAAGATRECRILPFAAKGLRAS